MTAAGPASGLAWLIPAGVAGPDVAGVAAAVLRSRMSFLSRAGLTRSVTMSC